MDGNDHNFSSGLTIGRAGSGASARPSSRAQAGAPISSTRRPHCSSLATAIAKARGASMPNDNIQRAIDRGTGEGADAEAIERILYEGYGPGGAAMLVAALSYGIPMEFFFSTALDSLRINDFASETQESASLP